jgi:hypothetical protein
MANIVALALLSRRAFLEIAGRRQIIFLCVESKRQ